jgi:hypothetical protein
MALKAGEVGKYLRWDGSRRLCRAHTASICLKGQSPAIARRRLTLPLPEHPIEMADIVVSDLTGHLVNRPAFFPQELFSSLQTPSSQKPLQGKTGNTLEDPAQMGAAHIGLPGHPREQARILVGTFNELKGRTHDLKMRNGCLMVNGRRHHFQLRFSGGSLGRDMHPIAARRRRANASASAILMQNGAREMPAADH